MRDSPIQTYAIINMPVNLTFLVVIEKKGKKGKKRKEKRVCIYARNQICRSNESARRNAKYKTKTKSKSESQNDAKNAPGSRMPTRTGSDEKKNKKEGRARETSMRI